MDDVLVGDLPPALVRVFAFAFGAAIGSFLNVVIYRLPRNLSVVRPGSFCPSCKTPVKARDNLPIFGWLLLRGRTRCCRTKLSPRYPIVEALVAMLALAVAERWLVNADADVAAGRALLEAVWLFGVVAALVAVAFIDLDTMIVPDEIVLPGAAMALVVSSIRHEPGADAAALGAGAGFLVVQVLFVWVYERFAGRRGMGEGDAKLLLFVGAAFGWRGAIFSLVLGAVQGTLAALVLLLAGRKLAPDVPADVIEAEAKAEGVAVEQAREQVATEDPAPAYVGHLKMPFGPFLALAAIEYLFLGDSLWSLYD